MMKKLFLFTVLLSFACMVNGCSSDTPDCGCNSDFNQTVTAQEGLLRVYEYDNGDISFIIINNVGNTSKRFYVCNKSFVNSNLNVIEDNTLVIFSGKYTDACLNTHPGVQPTDVPPVYNIKLTYIELQ